MNEAGLVIDKPIKLVGDENNPANVVIEMSGSIQWTARGGWIEGITFRRPKIAGGELPTLPILEVKDNGKIDMIENSFDNDGSTGSVVVLSGSGNKGKWTGVTIRNGGSAGIELDGEMQLNLINCTVQGNQKDGIAISNNASIEMKNCNIMKNKGYGIHLAKGCQGVMQRSHFSGNIKGVLHRETGCSLSCSNNTAIVSVPVKQIPGFKMTPQNPIGA